MRQLAELRANGTGSPAATQIVNQYRCSESHCSNHQKHCFRVSSTHYPLSANDILFWTGAMVNGTATLEKPPGIVWEALLSRKSQDLEAKRKGCEGHRRAIRMSNNPGSQSSIVKVYVNESSHSRCQLRDEGSPSDSSSSDSSHYYCRRHHREPAAALQSSPAQHNDVHLQSYKSWYNSKYSSGEDIVTEEQ